MLVNSPLSYSILKSVLVIFAFAVPSLGAVIYVDVNQHGPQDGTSWQSAFTNPQSALAVAQSGDQIWVAQGVYLPTQDGDRKVSLFSGEAVRVNAALAGPEPGWDRGNPAVPA